MTEPSSDNDFNFPERQSFPFTIGGRSYTLKEAGGLAGKRYRNSLLSSAKMGKDGEATGVDGEKFIGKDYQLLVDCCYASTADGKERPVNLEEVLAWPERAISKLVDKCKEMSDLDNTGGPDAIRKQIETLQKQLDKAEGRPTPKELAKNAQSSGETPSPTASN